MKSLDEIMVDCQSDKASQFSRTWAKPHDYCRHLELFFEPLRAKPIKILEIGVGGGESIKGWLEYFYHARIYGVDNAPNTNEYNTIGKTPNNRYTFVSGDQSNRVFWKKFVQVYGGEWSIVIDDGSHVSQHILTTLSCLFPHVKSGGFYEIEDLNNAPEAQTFLRGLADDINCGKNEFDSIFFARELCVIRKR